MRVSVIVATYNNVPALQLAFDSLLEQTRPPDEIVVADDGSRLETSSAIARRARTSPVPILHAWQEDDGFRLAASRNNAIRMSGCDYLVFLDGDCFVHRGFVEDHLRSARPGRFVAGTRVNVRPSRQRYILRTGDRRLSVLSWGTSKKLNAIHCPRLGWFSRSRPGFAGANFSAWREDLVRINGFNEDFRGHGGEDLDLSLRLENAGLRRHRLVHSGIAYHLTHPEHPRGDAGEVARLLEPARRGATWCERGLDRSGRMRVSPLRRAA